MSSNTQILLKELLKQEYSRTALYPSESEYFGYFCISQALKNYELSDEEIDNGLLDGGGDGGCDAFYLFLNNSLLPYEQIEDLTAPKDSTLEIVIFQSKKTPSFTEETLLKWKTLCENLLDLTHAITDYRQRYKVELLEAFQGFRDSHAKLISSRIKLKFSFFYTTLASECHPNVQAHAAELENQTIRRFYPSASVQVTFLGAEELFNMYNTRAESRMSLKLVETPIVPNQKKNYVVLVGLPTYYKFIVDESGTIRKRLFESNVRDYQGSNNVNSCIAQSLAEQNSEDFWWLNNGVTIIASDVCLESSKEITITNPEIVNGLQTSTEISNFFTKNPQALENDTRTILIRIIVPDSEESRDRIIFATNNQTGVHKSTLRVTDPIHLQIELYFKSRGLYYDRRKNHYKNKGKKPSEIVSVTFLGQCLYSLVLRKPDYARARPSNLLTDDDVYAKLYDETINLAFFYKAAYFGKRVENNIKAVTEYSSTEKNDIKFFVLYGVLFALLRKSEYIPMDIIDLDIDLFSDELISKIRDKVYKLYLDLKSENTRIAKTSAFVDRVEAAIAP